MSPEEALLFVNEHGIVLASAKGPAPRLAEIIAGEPIKGSWWAHPKSRDIFQVFQSLGERPDILVCKLVDGKVTFVHRRLWPALIRMAHRFAAERLAQVDQLHTETGRHVNRVVPFPDWADPESLDEARLLGEPEALAALGDWAAAELR
jgi:hypothetical protein